MTDYARDLIRRLVDAFNTYAIDCSHEDLLREARSYLSPPELAAGYGQSREEPTEYSEYDELIRTHHYVKGIYNSSMSWEAKYDLIFTEKVTSRVKFSWYDPDTSYEEDVTAFVSAFDEYVGAKD